MAIFAVCKQFRPRLNVTEHLILYTRGELTIGAKRLVGAKQSVGKRLEAKRLGEEMVWGQHVPDSPKQFLHK